MQTGVHDSFARRMAAFLGDKLPAQALLSGAMAPNREAGWPKPHHRNRKARLVIAKAVRAARGHYLNRQYQKAGFQLGVAAHFALDNMVPYRPAAREHAATESEFTLADHGMSYPPEIETELCDGRLAERTIQQLVRLGHGPSVRAKERLAAAHVALLRLAAAVTEAAEPLELLEDLAEDYVGMASQLNARVRRCKQLVERAFAGDGQTALGGEEGRTPPIEVGRFSERAVGLQEVLTARGETPALHTAALSWLGLRRLRRRQLAALAEMLGAEDNTGRSREECTALATSYDRAISLAERRRSHWDWFTIRWSFWHRSGQQALERALGEIGRAEEKVFAEEEEQFRARCAAAVLGRDAPAGPPAEERRPSRPGLSRLLVCVLPVAAFAAAAGALLLAGRFSVSAAGVAFAAGTGAYLLYARRMLRNRDALLASAAQAADEQPSETE